MKNFTLNNRSFKIATMLLSFLIAGAFSLSAEEYKSMIRYDRVWEYINSQWLDRQVCYVKFDGQKEINGKTYHRLVAFKTAGYDYDSDGQPYLFDINNNYFWHEGYLREEDGKVYTLVMTDPLMINPSVMLFTAEYDQSKDYRLEEKLLYDFTLKEGESYKGLQIQFDMGVEMDYKVMSVEHVEIEGEDHRLMRICPDDGWDYKNGEPIVEGIGIASYGCLTTINFLIQPSCPCYNHIFNRVLSLDGKVLYRNEEDCAEIPLNDFAAVDRVQEQPDADSPLYDILGRRITDPAPGQLYIRNGKKFVRK